MLKAKEAENLKQKYKTLSQRSIGRSSSIELTLTETTRKTLAKKVEIYKKEHEYMKSRLTLPINSEVMIQNKIKQMKTHLLLLEKENIRLNSYKTGSVPILPSISYKTVYEEYYREIKFLKQSIKDLEQTLARNPVESKQKNEYFQKLLIKYQKLKEEAGDYVKILPNKKFLKMQKKLEVLRTSWKNNVVKYQQNITELEEEAARLKATFMQLTVKGFKKSQQERLLKMSFDEVVLSKDKHQLSVKPDIDHPGVSFMYKPSVKSLYNIS